MLYIYSCRGIKNIKNNGEERYFKTLIHRLTDWLTDWLTDAKTLNGTITRLLMPRGKGKKSGRHDGMPWKKSKNKKWTALRRSRKRGGDGEGGEGGGGGGGGGRRVGVCDLARRAGYEGWGRGMGRGGLLVSKYSKSCFHLFEASRGVCLLPSPSLHPPFLLTWDPQPFFTLLLTLTSLNHSIRTPTTCPATARPSFP